MINIDKYTITSFDMLTMFNAAKELEFIMDELTDTTISNSEEKGEITGKKGRVVKYLKKNKAVKVSGTNGFIVAGALAAQVGDDNVTVGKNVINVTDAIIFDGTGTTVATTRKAVGTPGNEIGTIYVSDNTADAIYLPGCKKLTQVASTPTSGQFTYDPETKTITFAENDVKKGNELYMFYESEVEKSVAIENDSEHFSKVLNGYLDVTCEDACDGLYHGQFIFPRADFSGEFEISGGSDAVTHGFEFDSLPNICSGETKLWRFIVYED